MATVRETWLSLKRFYKGSEYTIGRFYHWNNGLMHYICDSIEDRDRGLVSTWPLQKILAGKKYGVTAIPTGTYELVPTVSPKFKNRTWAKRYNGIVPEIKDVPGFSGVRIHPANKADELLGCVGPGLNTVKGQVTQSQKHYFVLMDKYLMPAWGRGEKVYLKVE